MKYDFLSIVGLCAIIAAFFWLFGFCMLLVAVQKGRSEFRSKGYLRTPSGVRWLRFLLMKQYEFFGDPAVRFFFGVAHFCLMGLMLALLAIVLLVGSEFLLKGMYGLPESTYITPGASIPQ